MSWHAWRCCLRCLSGSNRASLHRMTPRPRHRRSSSCWRAGHGRALPAAWESMGTLLGWTFVYALGGLVDEAYAAAVSRDWFDEWLLRRWSRERSTSSDSQSRHSSV